jgi:predicted ATPase
MAQTSSPTLTSALQLPSGARFYKCALQVNPFAYLGRHNKSTVYKTEADYNSAIVAACKAQDIEVIAVTDHYRVDESKGLLTAARDAGIAAFCGFEAVAKDGVHFLCIFDPDKEATLERFIGECGIHDKNQLSPTGSKDSLELLDAAKRWCSIVIAAHVAADGGGLLKKLSGQTRMNVWKSKDLLACALAGPIDQAPVNLLAILGNTDPAHKRDYPIAVINAQDASSPEDLAKPGASCLIKMSEVSVEGLRQAFLDHGSRIRLNSDPAPDAHVEFLSMSWEGGFLDGAKIHFNENLNVLVGGRGTGKSTLIESLRYVLALDPLGNEAQAAHEGVLKHVLKNGTKISLLLRSHRPAQRCYTIERTVPNPPVVKDEAGAIMSALKPQDVVPGVEVFGQHEISELTKSREKLTVLLNRFVEHDPTVTARKAQLKLELQRSRARLLEAQREISAASDRLAALPALEEKAKRYQQAGVETRLKEMRLLVREEQVLASIGNRSEPFVSLREEIRKRLPVDGSFLSDEALSGLPNAALLSEGLTIVTALDKGMTEVVELLTRSLGQARDQLDALKLQWNEKKKVADERYQSLLRDLQKDAIDGEECISLARQIEDLRPLKEQQQALVDELSEKQTSRRQLLDEWIDLQSVQYRALQKAAKKVSKKLKDRVRVDVAMAGDRAALDQLLRDRLGGNLAALLERLRSREALSLLDLATRCREGKDALISNYNLPPAGAERLAQAGEELFMQIEELELPPTTKIELNTAAEGADATWQSLEALSTGQKATAVLLLLLLESDAPLVVDQPEDDLDNRFITDGVVPTMRDEKRRRQFIFSTHNANIPVLGDAELILGLSTEVQQGTIQGRICPEHMGSIDARPVRELVEEILEGGKMAFEMRRLKYGF